MGTASREKNLELARRGIDAYNRGDLEAVVELLSPQVEVYAPPQLINAGTYRGRHGFLEWVRRWDEVWEERHIEAERIEPVGEDHVVVSVHQFGKGGGSGIHVEMRIAQLFEIQDGEVVRFHLYPDRETAFAAAERFSGEADQSA
jgi:ketosteroid isomerase-like protein